MFEYRPCLKGIKTAAHVGCDTKELFEYRPCLKGIKTNRLESEELGNRLNTDPV